MKMLDDKMIRLYLKWSKNKNKKKNNKAKSRLRKDFNRYKWVRYKSIEKIINELFEYNKER